MKSSSQELKTADKKRLNLERNQQRGKSSSIEKSVDEPAPILLVFCAAEKHALYFDETIKQHYN